MSGDTYPTLRVAAVQAAPVFLDRESTLDKVDVLVKSAAAEGADLVVFGELFLAGYPIWALVLRPVDLHPFFERQFQNAIEVPGRECARLAAIAAKYGVLLSIGVNEKSALSMGTMWNSNLIFDRSGALINHRRKLVGTYTERLVYAPGDAAGLTAVETDGARIGMLICGENTNTLARFSLLAQGENIHIATYPPCGVFERTAKNFDITDAIRIRAAAHSFEGKVFTVAASTLPDEDAIEQVSRGDAEARDLLTAASPSASMIVGPRGELLAEPLIGEEGIVIANVDLNTCIAPKLMHDIVGAYNRFDIFELNVRQQRLNPAHFNVDARADAGTQDVTRPSESLDTWPDDSVRAISDRIQVQQ